MSIREDLGEVLGEVISDSYSVYMRGLIAKDLKKRLKRETDEVARYYILMTLVKMLFRTDKRLPEYKAELRLLSNRLGNRQRRSENRLTA